MEVHKQKNQVVLGKKYSKLPPLDLLAIQKESWQKFLKSGIAEGLKVISPIKDQAGQRWQMNLGDYHLSSSNTTPQEAIRRGISYTVSIDCDITLTSLQTNRTWQKQTFLFDLPQMTQRGTFIINGVERCIVSQVTRAPGVYFTDSQDKRTGKTLYEAEIRPLFGSWLEFISNNNNVISARIDRRRKFPATVILKALGMTNKEIASQFGEIINPTLGVDTTQTRQEALIEIYQKMRPGEPAVIENAEEFFQNAFFNPRRYSLSSVGRYKINKRLGLKIKNNPDGLVLKKDDFIATLVYLTGLLEDKGKIDDIDHLANRYLRCVGELISQVPFRIGLSRFERMIRDRMVLLSRDQDVNLSALINSQPIIAAINEFFRTNRLSTILDQTNPLSELDNLRRLSVMGPGGLTRERAPFSIRDVSTSQYGRICPVRSPEGQNIGLVTYLALYAKVNEHGFLETPYKKVIKEAKGGKTRVRVTDEVVYLQADDEEEYHITANDVNLDDQGYIVDKLVPARFQGEFLDVSADQVDLIDICPRQIVGVSASLIPFLDHDEPSRALMGSHMECQAVPLINPDAPLVGTGMEKAIPQALGRTITARHSGKVTYADGQRVVVKLDDPESIKEEELDNDNIQINDDEEIYLINKFVRTSPYGTCYSQKPAVNTGQKIKKGDLVVDGPSCDQGELALGKNLTVAYCSFEGLGYEDAIVISDRLVKEDLLTSITINEYVAEVADTKLGPEELTADIPNVSEEELAKLGDDGIVVIGSHVAANDILVGKIAPKGETELTAEERLLRAIFGEKAREVRDTSLRMPHGVEGVVVEVQILDREEDEELASGISKKVIVRVAQMRKIKVGDKLSGRHGNKGVISKIVSEADMPYSADGTPVDLIISPLSVLSRMNLGQLLEAHLGLAAKSLGYRVAIPVFEKFDENFLAQEFKKAGLPEDYKLTLFDGRTGEPYEEKVVVGNAHILKLVHMIEDKIHARSIGPYSLVTQQPLGGKAQMGGQRFGEMEVWGLEAHQAAHALQEMITIKSDDVVGRAKAFEAIVKGTQIPQSRIPESFKVLISELKSLGLAVTPEGVVKEISEENLEQEEVREEAGEAVSLPKTQAEEKEMAKKEKKAVEPDVVEEKETVEKKPKKAEKNPKEDKEKTNEKKEKIS